MRRAILLLGTMLVMLVGAGGMVLATNHYYECQPSNVVPNCQCPDDRRVCIGTTGADNILGAQPVSGADYDDKIFAKDGDDIVYGYSGGDYIDAGPGDDYIEGDHRAYPAHDVLIGGDGDDTIQGNGGNDQIYGGPGNDVCYVAAGDEYGPSCEKPVPY